jgi:hypothetical protein
VGRLLAVVATAALVAGCQVTSTATPPPRPSPTPHASVAAAVLQSSDVPAELKPCPSSGSVDTYITALQSADASLAQRVAGQWQSLKKEGATEGVIALFSADPSACSAELAATGTVKSEASLVVAFGDEGEADRAWQGGILGFVPPAPGELPPGMARGPGTGLGTTSWTYDRSPVRLACWRRTVLVALVVTNNLDGAAFSGAAAAVDARIH